MRDVARECFRVLKPDHLYAVLIDDTGRNLHYIPGIPSNRPALKLQNFKSN